MVQPKTQTMNQNIKIIFNYLDKQYLCSFDTEEIEQDIEMGYTDLSKELYNAYSALITMKEYNKNNSKKVSEINKYLSLLMKENKC
jgi:hypothetical protein